MKNKLYMLLIVLSVVFLLETISIYIWANSKKRTLQSGYKLKIKVEQLKQEKEKKKLNDEFEKNKYLASGKNVYERIYNKQRQNIVALIENLSKEAFPNDWECEVKVEEFTNFILLVQIGRHKPSVSGIMKYIIPIVKYGNPYLKNIAVFDKKHKCYLFFDERALNELKTKCTLNYNIIADIRNKGYAFTRYNSVKLKFERWNEHILIPVVVSGESGVYECSMMLDTGASMTVVSLEMAQKTGGEDLNTAEKRTFSTAKGLLTCPIIKRKISVGNIDKEQLVAVNLEDKTNLLGVDFFKGRNYMIDTKSKCIYVWNK